jgi:hypothetical protein
LPKARNATVERLTWALASLTALVLLWHLGAGLAHNR